MLRLFALLLCVLLLMGCGDSPSQAPSTPKAHEPDQEEGPAKVAKEDEFIPPPDWCGTGRVDVEHRMDNWREPDAGGRKKRKFVRHTGAGWILVTECGETRNGRFETWEEESELPGGWADAAIATQGGGWLKRLKDKDEEVVFVTALALGTHGVRDAVRPLSDVLWRHHGHHARLAAAIGLGRIGDADAVRFLIVGLSDDHTLVRTAVGEALHRITGHEIEAPTGAAPDDVSGQFKKEWRIYWVTKEWRSWWRDNESTVRQRLARKK